jgi:hypothetical protein
MNWDLTILNTLAAFLSEQLKTELISQQHSATGQLVDSVNVYVEGGGNLVEIKGESLFYGAYVNRGRPAGIKKVFYFK